MNNLTAITSPRGGRAVVAQGKIINYKPSEAYMSMRICHSIRECVTPPLAEKVRKLEMRKFAIARLFPVIIKHFQEKYAADNN